MLQQWSVSESRSVKLTAICVPNVLQKAFCGCVVYPLKFAQSGPLDEVDSLRSLAGFSAYLLNVFLVTFNVFLCR